MSLDKLDLLSSGGVKASSVAGAGQGDVDALTVQAVRTDHEDVIARDTLRLVHRHRIPVVEPAASHILAVQHDTTAGTFQRDRHRCGPRIEGHDGADHAVVDSDSGRTAGR